MTPVPGVTELAEALTREHRAIDGGIEAFVASLKPGGSASGAAPAPGPGAPANGGVVGAGGEAGGQPGAGGTPPYAGPDERALEGAVAALRRHIYLEETFLFPELEAAGLWPALMVMHREHGEIWRSMDRLAGRVDGLPSSPPADVREEVLHECRALLDILDRHNGKEEPIVYPRADTELGSQQAQRLAEFMRTGTTPEGWVCREAKAAT